MQRCQSPEEKDNKTGDACVMEKGKIIQVSGPVIDVLFEKGNLPHIKDALKVDNHGKE